MDNTKMMLKNMKKCRVRIKKRNLELEMNKINSKNNQRKARKRIKTSLPTQTTNNKSTKMSHSTKKKDNNEQISKRSRTFKNQIFIRFPSSSSNRYKSKVNPKNLTKNISLKSEKQKPVQRRKFDTHFIINKFGKKYLSCYVKVKRLKLSNLKISPNKSVKQNNRKTVSFVETVEIFDYSSNTKMPNGNKELLVQPSFKDDSLQDPLSLDIGATSTPVGGRQLRTLAERKIHNTTDEIKPKREKRSCNMNKLVAYDMSSSDSSDDEILTSKKKNNKDTKESPKKNSLDTKIDNSIKQTSRRRRSAFYHLINDSDDENNDEVDVTPKKSRKNEQNENENENGNSSKKEEKTKTQSEPMDSDSDDILLSNIKSGENLSTQSKPIDKNSDDILLSSIKSGENISTPKKNKNIQKSTERHTPSPFTVMYSDINKSTPKKKDLKTTPEKKDLKSTPEKEDLKSTPEEKSSQQSCDDARLSIHGRKSYREENYEVNNEQSKNSPTKSPTVQNKIFNEDVSNISLNDNELESTPKSSSIELNRKSPTADNTTTDNAISIRNDDNCKGNESDKDDEIIINNDSSDSDSLLGGISKINNDDRSKNGTNLGNIDLFDIVKNTAVQNNTQPIEERYEDDRDSSIGDSNRNSPSSKLLKSSNNPSLNQVQYDNVLNKDTKVVDTFTNDKNDDDFSDADEFMETKSSGTVGVVIEDNSDIISEDIEPLPYSDANEINLEQTINKECNDNNDNNENKKESESSFSLNKLLKIFK